MEKSYYKSPVGNLEIVIKNNELISLKRVDKTEKSDIETDFAKDVKSQLDEYFSGQRHIFDIKINPDGTDFQKKVWTELLKVPYGKTKSYSDIAKLIGNKTAQRAVGNACNKNPVMIVIPCHRIISKSGKPGGFACGIFVKQKLLQYEAGIRLLTDK